MYTLSRYYKLILRVTRGKRNYILYAFMMQEASSMDIAV
jgi:hypothetical protein